MGILLKFCRIKIAHKASLQQNFHLLGLLAFPICSHHVANICMTLTLHAHNFATKPCKNAISLYLERARLIDKIRIILHTNSSHSLVSILKDPALDSFVVTNALRSAPSPDSALTLIETLKKIPDFTHNQNTLYALAKILAKSGQTGKLKALINGINSGKFKNVTRVSLMDQMQLYSAAGDLDSVLSVWHYWRVSQKRPNVESYNIIIKLCAQTGKDYEAVKTFSRMIDEGGVPNSRTYTVIIEHLVKSGNLGPAMEVFYMLPSMGVKHTLKQYSILVDAYCDTEQFDVVKHLLSEMQVDGIFPSRVMLSSLQQMHDAGFVEETVELIKEMLPDSRIENVKFSSNDDDDDDDDDDEDDDDGDDVNGVRLRPWFDPAILANSLRFWRPEEVAALDDAKFVWTTRIVSKMIRSFSSTESAWQFFCWVAKQPGFSHDVHTISKMITILAGDKRVDIVEQLISMIKNDGNFQLSYNTVKVIIDSYGISGNGEAAVKIFQDVNALCGTLSKQRLLSLHSSLLRTLAKCKMDSKALDTLDEMILSGIIPDIQTFSGLMHHFALSGNIKTVQRLFGMVKQSGLEPDNYMFMVLICAYCSNNRAVLALRAFEDMKTLNLRPDTSTKRLLVKSLWKEGKLREAAAVEETSEDTTDVLMVSVRGNSCTTSAADLQNVYRVYSGAKNEPYKSSH